jgi:hypothetical protein
MAGRSYWMIVSSAPNLTESPSATGGRFTVSAWGAGLWFVVFIASTINKVSPSSTLSLTLAKGGGVGFGLPERGAQIENGAFGGAVLAAQHHGNDIPRCTSHR